MYYQFIYVYKNYYVLLQMDWIGWNPITKDYGTWQNIRMEGHNRNVNGKESQAWSWEWITRRKQQRKSKVLEATSCPHFFRLRAVLVIILKPQTTYTSCPMDLSPKIFTCLEISFKLLLKYLVHSSYESPQSTLTTIMNWEVFYHVSSEIWNCLTNQLMLDEKKMTRRIRIFQDQ